MTQEQKQAIARGIILTHAQDVEFMSIWEMTEDDKHLAELTEDERDVVIREIDDLVSSAKVTVSW